MIVFPAIDLREGRCVSLLQGEPDEETVYSDEPTALALRFQEAGAEWLHVVNLDGAFAGTLDTSHRPSELPVNLRRLCDIAAAVDIPIQFGGGLRTLDDVHRVLSLGVSRVVLGTVAARQPSLVSEALADFGAEQIAVGLDARDGIVATHGWQQSSNVTAIDLGRQMRQRGVELAIYTDITRDSMLGGVNVSATATLALQTGLDVIASGGVASVQDIHALRRLASTGITGVIIGKALYTGAVNLEEAIAAAR